jgi:hypothetical protein
MGDMVNASTIQLGERFATGMEATRAAWSVQWKSALEEVARD